jgi:hypothetical protein
MTSKQEKSALAATRPARPYWVIGSAGERCLGSVVAGLLSSINVDFKKLDLNYAIQ